MTTTALLDRPRSLAAERKRRERQRTRDGVQLYHLALDPIAVAETLLKAGLIREREAQLCPEIVTAALEKFVQTSLFVSRRP